MRLIDADYIKSNLNKAALGGHLHYYVCGVIDDAPTIEAEPVVKCKDCAFVDTLECPLNYIDKQRQIYTNRAPDWFCAEGRRKDELSET